jgi:hypothetical protein
MRQMNQIGEKQKDITKISERSSNRQYVPFTIPADSCITGYFAMSQSSNRQLLNSVRPELTLKTRLKSTLREDPRSNLFWENVLIYFTTSLDRCELNESIIENCHNASTFDQTGNWMANWIRKASQNWEFTSDGIISQFAKTDRIRVTIGLFDIGMGEILICRWTSRQLWTVSDRIVNKLDTLPDSTAISNSKYRQLPGWNLQSLFSLDQRNYIETQPRRLKIPRWNWRRLSLTFQSA